MKKFALILLIALFTPLLNAQTDTLNCINFHTGYFVYPMEGFDALLVHRTADLQEETDLQKGITWKFDVTWKSDCEYELKLIESNDETNRVEPGTVLTARIYETTPDTYQYTAVLDGKPTRGMMIKISPKAAIKMKKKFADAEE